MCCGLATFYRIHRSMISFFHPLDRFSTWKLPFFHTVRFSPHLSTHCLRTSRTQSSPSASLCGALWVSLCVGAQDPSGILRTPYFSYKERLRQKVYPLSFGGGVDPSIRPLSHSLLLNPSRKKGLVRGLDPSF